jgi:PAS domain-containing protein
MELEVITPEGETRWQKWTIKVFIDEKGSIIEYQYVGRDITDRKMVEIELEKYREQLEDLVEKRTFELKKSCEELERESEVRKVAEDQVKNMALFAELNPSPVLRFDIDGRIIMANPAAQDILGDSILLVKK